MEGSRDALMDGVGGMFADTEASAESKASADPDAGVESEAGGSQRPQDHVEPCAGKCGQGG